MFFPAPQRHLPKRNVLPVPVVRDDAARKEVARLSAEVQELNREMRTQFTRIAQLQQELDEIKTLLKTRLQKK